MVCLFTVAEEKEEEVLRVGRCCSIYIYIPGAADADAPKHQPEHNTAGNEPCTVVITEVIFLFVLAGKLLRKPEHFVTQLSPSSLFKFRLKNKFRRGISNKSTGTLTVGL